MCFERAGSEESLDYLTFLGGFFTGDESINCMISEPLRWPQSEDIKPRQVELVL